jgi:hypothetical protein
VEAERRIRDAVPDRLVGPGIHVLPCLQVAQLDQAGQLVTKRRVVGEPRALGDLIPLRAAARHRPQDGAVLGYVPEPLLLVQGGLHQEADLPALGEKQAGRVFGGAAVRIHGREVPGRPPEHAIGEGALPEIGEGRHLARVPVVERLQAVLPGETAVQRPPSARQGLHRPHRRSGEDQQEGSGRPPPLPGRIELRRHRRDARLVVGEVLELVEDDHQGLRGPEVQEEVEDRSPGGIVLGPEVLPDPAGEIRYELAPIDLGRGPRGREEEHRLWVPRVGEEIRLPDAAPAGEQGELRLSRSNQLVQFGALALPVNEDGTRLGFHIHDCKYKCMQSYLQAISPARQECGFYDTPIAGPCPAARRIPTG